MAQKLLIFVKSLHCYSNSGAFERLTNTSGVISITSVFILSFNVVAASLQGVTRQNRRIKGRDSFFFYWSVVAVFVPVIYNEILLSHKKKEILPFAVM